MYKINGITVKTGEVLYLNPGETIVVQGDNSNVNIINVENGGVYVDCGEAETCNVEIIQSDNSDNSTHIPDDDYTPPNVPN